jgi:hypothetical protein
MSVTGIGGAAPVLCAACLEHAHQSASDAADLDRDVLPCQPVEPQPDVPATADSRRVAILAVWTLAKLATDPEAPDGTGARVAQVVVAAGADQVEPVARLGANDDLLIDKQRSRGSPKPSFHRNETEEIFVGTAVCDHRDLATTPARLQVRRNKALALNQHVPLLAN